MDGPPVSSSQSKSVDSEERIANYRPEIDGLRAIAVITVIAFHFFPSWCGGGFVGVDVFFVISGFLISGILLRDQRSRTAALLSFYQHRIRRIFPALLIVMIATGVAGAFVLLPDEFKELRREALASCGFVANFLFARTDNYFDPSSSSKVFLHLWSLSIEEQFYLVWPALVVLGKNWRYKGPIFLITMAASLALSALQGVTHPIEAFFSPLTRAWELGLGGFLAWKLESTASNSASLLSRPNRPPGRLATALGVAGMLGMLLILASAFLIGATQPYPGVLATLPTAGAFLIIAAGRNGPVGNLLGGRLSVAVGRLSYPLYLWHWPILVLATLVFGEAMSVSLKVSLIALAAVLAQLTYSLIELPVRRSLSLARAALLFAALMLAVAAVFALIGPKKPNDPIYLRGVRSWTGGMNLQLLGWFSADPACLAQIGLEDEAKRASGGVFCSISPGTAPLSVAVIGDSTANSLFPGLADLYAKSGRRIFNAGNGTCAPFRGLGGTFYYNEVCSVVNEKMYRYVIANPQIKTVIWSVAPWDIRNMLIPGLPPNPSLDDRFAAIQPLVRRDLDELTKAGKRVVFTFDTPNLKFEPRICINDPSQCVRDGRDVIAALEPYRTKWQQLVAGMPGVCVFSQRDLFRQPDGHYQFMRNDLLLFRDDHHLSTLGSEFVANAFAASACFK